ncbi:MAG: citrate lyase subunit alpha, partial [Prevotella bivia]|nr:citrate lyase subunit alpha [Prevotella bivia]
IAPKMDMQKTCSKLVTLEEAIRKSGLKDGMTISFHHHIRAGDKVVNMVVDKLAEMGFKDLHLAACSFIIAALSCMLFIVCPPLLRYPMRWQDRWYAVL